MYYKQEIGKFGEDKVSEYLINNNYTMVHKNYRCKFGEIDLIAKDDDKNELVFFEVKTRNNKSYGSPVEAVTKIKQKHIYKTAQCFLHRYNLEKEFVRIDVIEVYLRKNDKYFINHIKQIF